MFHEGDLIVYGSTGVCRVAGVGRPQNVRGADRERLYYTLEPLYLSGTIYAPVDTPVFMRPVLSRDAAEEMIARIPSIRAQEQGVSDQRMLSEQYRASFETHQCEDLLRLIKTIYAKSCRRAKNGQKPVQVDQRFQKRAEELLYGELAVALGIAREAVPDYIAQRVSQLQQAG